MLVYLTGSSCSGKTTIAFAVARRFPDMAVHDVDESGALRDAASEFWVRRALEYQERGTDMLVAGQAPLGEVLAAPSAPLLDGIAMCLVDVADQERRARLARRQPGKWDRAAVDAFVGWAAWHRGHALDPRHRPEVLVEGIRQGPAWHRWSGWTAEDPRWSTHVLDTTGRPIDLSVAQIEAWITEQRSAHTAGLLPLRRGWDVT
ncbi:hypothetical protein ACFY1L_38700 [Streptomyces sp. NPDC001663]|uniref:hypothetical protein n=1 Tax=Streptomyces sp. NPDC001663 TaxID=3364597 RepID=UPI0036965AD6